MNLDEIEALAKTNPDFESVQWRAAACPTTLLLLISQLRTLREALEKIRGEFLGPLEYRLIARDALAQLEEMK